MGKIRKTLKRLSFLLVGLAAVGGCLASVFFGTTDVASGKNDAFSTNLYQISYQDNELKLMANANIRAYRHISKQDILDLKDNLITVAGDAILEDVNLDTLGSLPSSRAKAPVKRANASAPVLDVSLLLNITTANLTNSSGDADIELVNDYLDDLTSGGSNCLMVQYYVDHYTSSYVASYLVYNPAANAADVEHDALTYICGELTATVQGLTNSAYTLAGETPIDVSAIINSVVFGVEGGSVTVNLQEFTGVVDLVQKAMDNDTSGTITVQNLVNDLGAANAEAEIKNVVKGASSNDITSFLTTIDSNIVADVVSIVGIDHNDMMEIIETIGVSNLVEVSSVIDASGLKEILHAAGVSGSEIKSFIRSNVRKVNPKDLIKMAKKITISDQVVFENGSFVTDGIISLIRSLPRPSEIRSFTDDQMKLSWHIVAETTLSSDPIDFTFTIGTFGDAKWIRRIAAILDETFEISVDNGVISIGIHVPQAFTDLATELLGAEYIGDDFKHFMYDTMFKSVTEIYDTFRGMILDEYIDLLEDIDYEALVQIYMSGYELNRIFNCERFTDDQIDTLINGFMSLVHLGTKVDYSDIQRFVELVSQDRIDTDDYSIIEKIVNEVKAILERIDAKDIDAAVLRRFFYDHTNEDVYELIERIQWHEDLYNRVIELLDRVFAKMPDRITDASVMDAYVGEGLFEFFGTIEIDLEGWLTAISPSYGERIYNGLSALFDRLPSQVTVDIWATTENLYSCTWVLPDGEKTGMLPVGADVVFYANCTEIDGHEVIGWADCNGDLYETMPEGDIVLYPVTGVVKPVPEDITYVYTGSAQTFEIDASPFYTITGGEQTDAGTYEVIVSLNDKTSDCWSDGTNDDLVFTWTIEKAEIDVSEYNEWDYDPATPFTYGDDNIEVKLVEEPNPAAVETVYANNTGVDAGDYTASVSFNLIDTNNYTLVGSVDDCDWSITKAIVEKPDEDTTEFIYNGQPQTYTVADSTLYSVSGNVQTNANTYSVSIALVDPDNYMWDDETSDALSYEFIINKLHIAEPAQDTSDYEYTGSAQTYQIATSEYYTVSDNVTQTEIGTYVITISLNDVTNTCWNSGSSDDLSYNFVIGKKHIEAPTADTTDFVYTGSAQTYTVASSEFYTVDGNVQTDAGTYTVTVSINNKDAYCWMDGTTDDVTFSFVIAKLEIAKPSADTTDFVYNASAQTYTVAASDYYTVSGNVQTNAGSYTVTVTLSDPDNVIWEGGSINDVTFTFTIAKLEIAKPSADTTDFVYNASAQTYTVATSDYYTVSGNVQTNAGSYEVTVSLNDTANTTWEGGTINDVKFSFVIAKLAVAAPSADTTDFVYNASAQTYTVATSDYYTVSGNVQTNAGSYEVTISLKDTANTTWEGGAINDIKFSFVIAKASVEKPAADTTEYEYTGSAQTYNIDNSQGLFNIENATQTNAGTYTVSVSLVDNANYMWSDNTPDPVLYTFIIAKASVNKPAEDTTEFVYNGSAQTYVVASSSNYTVSGNVQTDAGTYYVSIALVDTDNYEWVDGTTENLTYIFIINKAIITIDTSSITWSQTSDTYTGSEITVTISSTLPENVDVTYENNTATECGQYTAKATFHSTNSNYEIDENTLFVTHQWEIKQQPVGPTTKTDFESEETDENGTPIVTVNNPDGIDDSLTLGASDETEGFDFSDVDLASLLDGNIGVVQEVYDITFYDENGNEMPLNRDENGNIIDENCCFTVRILIPEELRGEEHHLIVVHIADDGTVTDMNAHRTEDNKYMEFTTQHFSHYAIVEVINQPSLWWVYVIIALLVVIIILQVLILLKKNNNNGNGQTIVNVNTGNEQQPAPAEEAAPVVAAAVAEEPVEEEEVRPDVPEEDFIIAADGTKELLNRSFEAKLRQTSEPVKAYYNAIKNEIMAYRFNGKKEKMRCNISWKHEMFICGNQKVAKFKIARKNLIVCLHLDPKKYADTKYKVDDGSGVAANKDLETLYTIKNDRRCDYCKDLIAEVMEPLNMKKVEVEPVNYVKEYRYASNKTLLNKGLIKVESAPSSLFEAPVEEDK